MKCFLIIIIFFFEILCKKISKKKKNNQKAMILTFIKSKIKSNSILIAEYQNYHLECLPGYTKYFTELGFNVDIMILPHQKESMEKFQPKNKIRIFEFRNKREILKHIKLYKKKLKEYKFVFLETLELINIDFYKKIGYLNNLNSLFVIHHIDRLYKYGINNSISKNEIFSLIDYGIIPYLNPNYFGEFNLTFEKNQKITFFTTSSMARNYTHFLYAVNFLHEKSVDFIINIVGRSGKFKEKNVPKKLKKYIRFYYNAKYQKLYEIVQKSDFIILNLYPEQKFDNLYRTHRATGNSQLSYGFYKPVLIEENFAKPYKFSNENAIFFKGNDLASAMFKATKISDEEYKNMSMNIKNLRDSIFNESLNNLKNVLKNNNLI